MSGRAKTPEELERERLEAEEKKRREAKRKALFARRKKKAPEEPPAPTPVNPDAPPPPQLPPKPAEADPEEDDPRVMTRRDRIREKVRPVLAKTEKPKDKSEWVREYRDPSAPVEKKEISVASGPGEFDRFLSEVQHLDKRRLSNVQPIVKSSLEAELAAEEAREQRRQERRRSAAGDEGVVAEAGPDPTTLEGLVQQAGGFYVEDDGVYRVSWKAPLGQHVTYEIRTSDVGPLKEMGFYAGDEAGEVHSVGSKFVSPAWVSKLTMPHEQFWVGIKPQHLDEDFVEVYVRGPAQDPLSPRGRKEASVASQISPRGPRK